MSSVEFKNVWKIYDGDVIAVRNANFRCENGEFIAILGPSGCGKSSSLRMIAGLEGVSDGEVLFDNQVVNDISPSGRNIALAFESYALYSPLTIFENIAFPLRVGGVSREIIKKRVREIAEALDLEDVLQRKPMHLSGGQKQRVSLARSLIRNPNVFLLDEPLSHMDQAVRSTLRARIRHIHDEAKTTTIYVTHDQEEAVALADRIIVMNLGTIQQVGSIQEVYDSPSNKFVAGFIGDPEMNFLEGKLEGNDRVAIKGNDGNKLWRIRKVFNKMKVKDEVYIGVRPDEVNITTSYDDFSLNAKVELVEYIGDYKLITCDVCGKKVKVLCSISTSYEKNQQVWISAEPNNIHVFDKETEIALLN